jgi:hypothetical protein
VEAPKDASDALLDDSLHLLSPQGGAFRDTHFFDLSPSTHDRPFFHSILRLSNLGRIIKNISQIPREEIGYLINVAVLAQSLLWALLVLLLPWLGRPGNNAPWSQVLKSLLYFSCLGLGFLFIEIVLIEKAAYFLGDRTYAFSVVLSAMLVFSGLGSWVAGFFTRQPQSGIRIAAGAVAIWLLGSWLGLDGLLAHYLGGSLQTKCVFLILWSALVSIPLGFFFPLGLSRLPRESGLIPWAWALNGAFSVVATPLANLLAINEGYHTLFLSGMALYALAFLAFPMGSAKAEGWRRS